MRYCVLCWRRGTYTNTGPETFIVISGSTPLGHTVFVEEIVAFSGFGVAQDGRDDTQSGKAFLDAFHAAVLVWTGIKLALRIF
jgi:hypothetical protein